MNPAEMWVAGKAYFPQAGEYYASLSREVGGTDNQGAAFNRYGSIPGTPVSGTSSGRVFPVREQACDEFQRILAQSGQNLYDTGDLIVRVANSFAHVDGEAGREIAAVYDSQCKEYAADPLYMMPDPATRAKPQPPA